MKYNNSQDDPQSPLGQEDLAGSPPIRHEGDERVLQDLHARIDSMRIELLRIEMECDPVGYLRDILHSNRADASRKKSVSAAYLIFVSLLPSLVKWLLRPLTRKVRWLVRRLASHNPIAPYRVAIASSERPDRRVLHVIANFMTGGSSRLVIDLIEGLGSSYRQEVLTGYIPAPLAYEGALVHERRHRYEIAELIRTYRPDLLHVHYWGDVDFAWYDKVFAAADQLGCKIIENVNTPVSPYRSKLVRQYVFVSNYVRQTYGNPADPNVLIYPGSDFSLFSSRTSSHHSDDTVGMVYRLEPDKLNPQSIDVFIEVARLRPRLKVLIIGDGSLLPHFKAAVAASGVTASFHFAGAVPYKALPDAYAKMSIFVAPVWKESFGQVSCFAMSMGIPVVGYRVGGLVEIVGDDELLAPPGDSSALAAIIARLMDDPQKRHEIGNQNRLRASELFSVEQMTSKYKSLYDVLVGDSR